MSAVVLILVVVLLPAPPGTAGIGVPPEACPGSLGISPEELCSEAFSDSALQRGLHGDDARRRAPVRVFAGRRGEGGWRPLPTSMRTSATLWEQQYRAGLEASWQTSLNAPKADLVQLFHGRLACLPPHRERPLVSVVLGCGLGVEVDFLANRAWEGRNIAVGVDFAPSAIAGARRQRVGSGIVELHEADICELPTPETTIDLIVDNTVWQNQRRLGPAYLDCYHAALRRLALPGHTLLQLSVMSREGVAARPAMAQALQNYHLPLNSREELLASFRPDWAFEFIREGLYELDPGAAGVDCPACETFGGIPSWTALAVRRRPVRSAR